MAQDPRTAVNADLTFKFTKLLENCKEHHLFKLTQFYRDRLEKAIEEEVKSISSVLKEKQHFSEKDHLKVVEQQSKAYSSKVLFTLVMGKGSAARKVMWESFVKMINRLPKLKRVLKEIHELGTDPADFMKLIRDFPEVPTQLKDIQKKHKEELRKKTEKLRMKTIQANEAVKIFQLVDRYAQLTVVSTIRDLKLVEHELLARGQEHEVWREKHLQKELELIQTDKLFCSSFSRSKSKFGSSTAVIGVPGIGKTTMVQKIVHDWATGKIYHKFQFVFSFKFRDLNDINCRVNLQELILDQYPYLQHLLREIWKFPEEILFIFDGLDEYNTRIDFADNRRNTEPKYMCTDPECWCAVSDIVYGLIQRKLLPGCSVLVTSRPTALNLLERAEIDVWAEILGFDHEERKEYFNKIFEDQTAAAALFKHVEENQILYTMSFNPSYCWILGQTLGPFFMKGKKLHRIPKTITELYSCYICNILKNHSFKKERDVMLKIGEMAFEGISEKNIVFKEGDLIKYNLQPSQFLSGFVMELLERDDTTQSVVYTFPHLTIQEFVAALAQFLTASPEDMKKLFEKAHREEDQRYELLLRFLAGFSSQSNQLLEEFLGEFPSEKIIQVIDWIGEEVHKQLVNTNSKASKRNLLNLFHYLFESQNRPLVKSTVGLVKKVTFSGLQMNPIDCAVLTNVIELCDTIKELDLQNCSIQYDGLQWLGRGLHKCEVLRLRDNKFGDSGVKLLSAVLKEPNCKIQQLMLNVNNLTADCTGDLSSALSKNQSLLELDLSNNKLEDAGMKNLSVFLKNPDSKIQYLRLNANSFTAACINDLSSALSTNQSLISLYLGNNELGDAGVRQFFKDLKNIQELGLENNNLSACCMKDLATTISEYQSLRSLNLSCNNLGDSGLKALSEALKKPNQRLEQLHLCSAKLTASCASDVASVLSISCTLKVLDLGGNKLEDHGMKLLCEALKNNSNSKIQTLQLWKNYLHDSCAEDLVSGLSGVCSLRKLNLSSNFFTDQSVEKFRTLTRNCSSLKIIELSFSVYSFFQPG
ncbi:NACHT, LRR and PYD domains-containing protein 3-like isoform X2 [Narcine bancroftii]|uniref:NACHT, LRR and PYD domains-containing protein 3-like isoform X2 n=1 Tax=Narcine bancroftii TaxID=1343680 RepID=UPI0038310363